MAETLGTLAWYLQYAGVYTVWIVLAIASIRCLAIHEGIHRFAFFSLWASCWYLSIQTHWIMDLAEHIPQWTELTWTLFETFVGGLLLWALMRRS